MKIKQSIQQHHHNNSLDTYQNFTRWKALPLSSSVSIDRPGVCVRLGRSDRFLWDRSFLGDDLLKNQFQMKSYWFQCELCSDTSKIPFSNGYPLHLKTYIKQLTTTTPTNHHSHQLVYCVDGRPRRPPCEWPNALNWMKINYYLLVPFTLLNLTPLFYT